MQQTTFAGLVPVLATPFGGDGALDVASLRRLVEFQRTSGADGVAVFGMASETFSLTEAERATILNETVRAAEGLPVVAGVAATGLDPARTQLRQVAAGGAVAAMVLPPYLVRPSPAQLIDFFSALAAQAQELGIGLMAQDAPGATGVTMPPALIAQLAGIDGLQCVKVEAPPTVPKMIAIAEELKDRPLAIMGGQNAQFVLDELACGAVGTMPACEFTDLLTPILLAWELGDRRGAREAFGRLLPLIVWGLQAGPAWAIHKEVLVRRGIIASAAVRAPAHPLPSAMRSLLEDVVASLFPVTTSTARD